MAGRAGKRDAPSVAPEVLGHYNHFPEAERLTSGRGLLERERTLDILRRTLPAPPATVYDIGGAAGVYAIPLAEEGYHVALFDPVARHIEQAAAAADQAGVVLHAAEVADARIVPRPDRSADAVLLMGPLYHLQDRAERMAALHEAHRILRPGGALLVTAISRFASLLDGVRAGALTDPEFAAIVARDLKDGCHLNPGNHPDYFTTAFFHHPDELRTELAEPGFTDVRIWAIEGPFAELPGGESRWEDDRFRSTVMAFLRRVEAEPSMLGASMHLAGIATAPTA